MDSSINITTNQVKTLLKNFSNLLSTNSSIKIEPGCNKTDGYVSYIYKIIITNKTNDNTTELIIKCAPEDKHHREIMTVRILYLSEIYFYSQIMPEFKKLATYFNNDNLPIIPTFITAVATPCKEVLVLEDMRSYGFGMIDKKLFLDEEHVKFVLKEFGHLHALSLTLKHKQRDVYEKMVQGLRDIHGGKNCNLNDECNSYYRAALKQTKELFQDNDVLHVKVLQKLEFIENHLEDYCEDFLEYKGEFGVVSHMDCWSNNMLFKYSENKLNSICFLDFQYIWVVSPAVDFSFILYVNGKPGEYPKLKKYLQYYYQSLSKHCKILGFDISEIYSYSIFLEEIKKYARYGYLRALIGIPMSMRENEEIIDIKDVVSNGIDDTSKAFGVEKWNQTCSNWMKTLTLHMIEHDFL